MLPAELDEADLLADREDVAGARDCSHPAQGSVTSGGRGSAGWEFRAWPACTPFTAERDWGSKWRRIGCLPAASKHWTLFTPAGICSDAQRASLGKSATTDESGVATTPPVADSRGWRIRSAANGCFELRSIDDETERERRR